MTGLILLLALSAFVFGQTNQATIHQNYSAWLSSDGSAGGAIGTAMPGGSAGSDLLFSSRTASTWSQSMKLTATGYFYPTAKTYAALGTPANGALVYCSDCVIQATCAGSGSGAIAKRLNGAWVCN